MTLQSSGTISLNDIHVEAGGGSGSNCSINDSDIRGLISKGSGASMNFAEWYGASNVTVYNVGAAGFGYSWYTSYVQWMYYAGSPSISNVNGQTLTNAIIQNNSGVATRGIEIDSGRKISNKATIYFKNDSNARLTTNNSTLLKPNSYIEVYYSGSLIATCDTWYNYSSGRYLVDTSVSHSNIIDYTKSQNPQNYNLIGYY
tara:strand:- start:2099 stop:2701 length:603 start_codon:yes stop_codon:yes gene_type:complete